MFPASMTIAGFDPELEAALAHERVRQEDHIELIASENYATPRVLEAQGSVLTNKYAEGYPGKRYYGGCEYVDIAEQLAIDRAKQLFGAAFANVQPHSGSQANAAAFLALIKPGDTLLGMSLDHGGHLTHGAKVNFSGKIFNAVQYGLDPATGEIDYAQVERLAHEHKPKMIIAGFSAYSRILDFPRFRQIADAVGAYFLVRHGARGRPRGRGRLSQPRAVCRRRHDHHAQDAARPARWPDPRARERRDHQEAQLDDLPGHAGRPADARDCRQGRRLPRGDAARVRAVPAAGRGERARDGRGVPAARPPHRLRRHRQPPVPARPVRPGHHGQGSRRGARPCAHHGQQELGAERSAAADGDQRHPHRHAGRDDAWFQGSRGQRSWRTGSPTCC